MKILMACGGALSLWPSINETYDLYVGIDRGGLFLRRQGLPVDVLIGDFDSISTEEQKQVFNEASVIKKSPSEKDETDTELGLAYVFENYKFAEVTMIGTTGGRIDHFLANLWLVLDARFQPFSHQIMMKDQQNTVQFLLPGEHTIKKELGMKYLAYCCLTAVESLTLTNSKYTLTNKTISRPYSYASNEFVDAVAHVSFQSGQIAVIQSKDQ